MSQLKRRSCLLQSEALLVSAGGSQEAADVHHSVLAQQDLSSRLYPIALDESSRESLHEKAKNVARCLVQLLSMSIIAGPCQGDPGSRRR